MNQESNLYKIATLALSMLIKAKTDIFDELGV